MSASPSQPSGDCNILGAGTGELKGRKAGIISEITSSSPPPLSQSCGLTLHEISKASFAAKDRNVLTTGPYSIRSNVDILFFNAFQLKTTLNYSWCVFSSQTGKS